MEHLSTDGVARAGYFLKEIYRKSVGIHLRLILISQTDGWQALAVQLGREGVPLNKCSEIQIQGPTDHDVQIVLQNAPGLLPIAYRREVLRALCNMKLLDLVVTQANLTPIEKKSAWTSLTQIVDWIWDKWLGTGQDRHARGEVLKKLGQMEAESFAQGIPKSQLDASVQGILATLEDQIKVVEVHSEKVFFSHDSISDWARYRSLLGEDNLLAESVQKLAIFPKWNSAIRLLGQFL